MEPVESVLKNIYQSNTCRKDLSWQHFDNQPRVQEKQQAKDQQPRIFILVVPIQFRREGQPQYLKRWFFLKNRFFLNHLFNVRTCLPILVEPIDLGNSVIIFLGHLLPPPFSSILPFLELQDVPTFYRPLRKTKVLNNLFNQFVYKFYPQFILILEEYLLKWWNTNLI